MILTLLFGVLRVAGLAGEGVLPVGTGGGMDARSKQGGGLCIGRLGALW